MASTVFNDYNQNNPIVSSWLNDVNGVAYAPSGLKKVASNSAAAWVRFSISGGVVTVQQSNNVASVVRSSAGVYVITYSNPMTQSSNCYSVTSNQAGFVENTAETVSSLTITASNTSNVPTDPGNVSIVVFGVN